MVVQYHLIPDNEALIINDIGRCASCHQPASGAHGIICRRQHTGTDAESAAEVGGDGRETLAPPQPNCALDMNRQVAIAKPEPILAAERRERFHERPGLVPPTPSELRIVEARKRVHQRVDVRRDMQAEMLEIIADIGHDEQIVPRHDPAQAQRELGAANASRYGNHKIPTHRNRSSFEERMMLAAVDPGADQRNPRAFLMWSRIRLTISLARSASLTTQP